MMKKLQKPKCLDAVMEVSLFSSLVEMTCCVQLLTHPLTLLYSSRSRSAMDLTWDFGEILNNKMTAKGVLDVTIKSSLKKITTVKAWQEASNEAEKILDCDIPNECGFHHVAFLMEDCHKDESCGWAAYAYINWWPMVFVNDDDGDNYGE